MTPDRGKVKKIRRYRVKEDVISQDLEGEEVILDLSRKIYYGLDPVGTKIWQGLQDQKSTDQITAGILREYDVGEKNLAEDVKKFCKDLEKHALIEQV